MIAIEWDAILPPWLGAALPLGVILTDAALCVRYWSPWLAEKSGLTAEQARGRPLGELCPEVSSRGLGRHYERALAGEAVTLRQREHGYLLTLPAPRNSAGIAHMQQRAVISPLVVEDEVVGTMTVIMDLTERSAQDTLLKRAISQQDEALALLDTLITKAPIGFALLDEELRYRGINERLAELNGLPVAEHLGRSIFEVVPDLADQQLPTFIKVIETGAPVTDVEIAGETRARPGERRVWQVSCYPVFASGQRRLGVGVLVTEVTEQRRLFAAAERSRALAEEAVQARDAFFSIAAHELRTPLTTLLGRAQMLQKWLEQDEGSQRSQRSIGIVVEQAQRLNRMITALLDVSRIQAGHFAVDQTSVDLAGLARRVVEETRPALSAHTLELREAGVPLVVQGDERRLEQVLQCLLSNAVKYSPGGGPVLVELAADGGEARLSVSDEGIGVPAAADGKLFRRFYRAENAEQHGISGLGIGLFLAAEIVELHDGRIGFASAEGEGSTFTVRLPLAEAPGDA